jgi:hypothetical protein
MELSARLARAQARVPPISFNATGIGRCAPQNVAPANKTVNPQLGGFGKVALLGESPRDLRSGLQSDQRRHYQKGGHIDRPSLQIGLHARR